MFFRQPCDVEWRYTDEGEEVRVSTRTGYVIPLPTEADKLEDGILPQTYEGTSISGFFTQFEIV